MVFLRRAGIGVICGQQLIKIPDAILAGIQQAGQAVTRNAGGQLVWPGLLRKLDRSGAPYQL